MRPDQARAVGKALLAAAGDGDALVMSTYGHPSDEAARARVLAAYRNNPAWRLKAVGD